MNAIMTVHRDVASPWIQHHQQKAILHSICSNYTMPDPNLEAGHTCLLDGINIMPAGYLNTTFTMEDCLDVEGNWTSYSCKEVQTLYTNTVEAKASDMLLLDMAFESLEDICCNDTLGNSTGPLLTKEEVRNGWWNAVKEWREGHSKNLTIITGVTSIISTIASSIFMWMILRSHDGLSTTPNRLLLGLCTGDICFSLPLSFFGIMVPNEVGYYSWNAMGSLATCQIQGFVNAFGSVCGTCYYTSLCLYYLAVVKYRKSDDYIRTKIEPFLHAVPVVVAMIFSNYTLSSRRFNASGIGTCVPSYYSPPHCWEVDKDFVVEGVFDIPCGRGDSNFCAYFLIIAFFCAICPAIIMITALTIIYGAVRQSEKKMSKYGVGSLRKNLQIKVQGKGDSDSVIEANPSRSRSSLSQSLGLGRLSCMGFNRSPERASTSTNKKKRETRSQSRPVMFKTFAYCCAWLLTWIFYVPLMIVANVFDSSNPPALVYLMIIFHPLQGLYNLAIYMHPKILWAKKKSKGGSNITWWQAFVTAFWSKGSDKKKRGCRSSVRDPPTYEYMLRNNSNNCESNKGRASSPPVDQNANHLSFGSIRRTSLSRSTY
jgi:hypothetical protein